MEAVQLQTQAALFGARPAVKPAAAKTDAQIEKAAQDFEAVFLGQMVDQMYTGLDAKGPFGGGFAEQTYRSLFTQEIGRQMSAGGGVGLAEAVYAEMVKLQGGEK